MRYRKLAIVSVVALALAACGGGEKVGEQFDTFEDQGGEVGDFELVNTPKPTQQANQNGNEQPQQTQAPAPTEAVALTIEINGTGFDPTKARMFINTILEVKNVDDKPHSFTDSNFVFDSGEIAPGATWRYKPQAVGTHQINDSTRTWVIGQLEVVAG